MKKFSRLVMPALCGLGLLVGVRSAYAAAGSLDPTFGNGGVTVTNLGSSSNVVTLAVNVLSGGKILVLVDPENTPSNEVVRYTSTGAMDTGFGKNGFAPVIGASMSIQSNGQIIIGAIVTDQNTEQQALAVQRLMMLPMQALGNCPETVVFAGATDGFNNGPNTSIGTALPPAAQAIVGLLKIVGISSNGLVTLPGGTLNPYKFTALGAPLMDPDGTTLSAWYRFSTSSEPTGFVFSCNDCIASWGVSVYQNVNRTQPIYALASDFRRFQQPTDVSCGNY